jgi:transcriptional regulator with XRE-family HTH domain
MRAPPTDTNETEAKELGRRLRQLRIRRGFRKARHLAAALKVNENTYYRYERGLNVPSLRMLKLICETMDVSICDLLPYNCGSNASGTRIQVGSPRALGAMQEDLQQTYEPRVEWLMRSRAGPDEPPASDFLFLSCSMSAWAVAEIAAELRWPTTGGNAHSVSSLATCAAVYLSLKRDPFGTIARLLEELKAAGVGTEVWERAGRGVERFTADYRAYYNAMQEMKSV